MLEERPSPVEASPIDGLCEDEWRTVTRRSSSSNKVKAPARVPRSKAPTTTRTTTTTTTSTMAATTTTKTLSPLVRHTYDPVCHVAPYPRTDMAAGSLWPSRPGELPRVLKSEPAVILDSIHGNSVIPVASILKNRSGTGTNPSAWTSKTQTGGDRVAEESKPEIRPPLHLGEPSTSSRS